MQRLIYLWKRISDNGISYIHENERRSVIFLNRINFFICIVSLLGFTGTILLYCVIEGGKPGVGVLRLLLMLISGLFSFTLTHFNRSFSAKVITSVVPLLLLIVFSTVMGDVANEYYYYYPTAGIASAMVPILLFPNREDQPALFILLFFCFLMTVTSDNLLSYFSASGKTPAMFAGRYFFYKLAQILLFFLIVSIVYTLKDLNSKYESILKEQNDRLLAQKEELTTQSEELLGLNEELNQANSYLASSNKELEIYKNNLEEIVELRTLALRESENNFRNIFEKSMHAIVIVDMKSKLLLVNMAFYTITGYSQDDGPAYATDIIIREQHDILFERLNRLSIENMLPPLEYKARFKNGEIHFVELTSSAMNYFGEKACLTIIRDITSLKEEEHRVMEAIINSEENERSRLAQDLHDGLGPVLSTIKLYFQVYKDAKDEAKRTMLAEKLTGTIQEAIKEVSEISHNISPHVFRNYGFYAALKQFVHRIALTNVVKINLDCTSEPELTQNSGIMLYRAICELINNSIKHASCKNISLVIQQKGDFMHVDYADDGRGFDFVAIKSSPARGSGLNNIVNRVNALKGRIDIESKADHGMKAYLKIPV
jgi:PAS domain S-box-containing protein